MCGPASRASLPVFFLRGERKGGRRGVLGGGGRRGGGERRDSGWRRGRRVVKGAPSCLLLLLSLSLSLSVSVSVCALFPQMSMSFQSGSSSFNQRRPLFYLLLLLFSCNQTAALQTLLCLCVDVSGTSFYSIHPSRFQPPNISAHCLHKVQMKSLITHSPIGSCLRIIERVAAVALTFSPLPPHWNARLLVRVGGRPRVHVLHTERQGHV